MRRQIVDRAGLDWRLRKKKIFIIVVLIVARLRIVLLDDTVLSF